jgi:uncharacterized alkaline shock family protein YloU
MTDAHVIESSAGTITVPPAVLTRIVVGAAAGVPAARARRPRRGVELDVDGGRVRVALELAVGFGEVVPDVAAGVQRRVAEALATMCELEVTAVDVAVEELDG